jgi:chromosome partitioning protein
MLTASETSQLLSISTARLKQILKSNPEYEYDRTSANNGAIKIPSETIRALLKARTGIKYPKETIIFASQKGGTGKTISTLTISTRLAEKYGCRVLLIDLDPESHSTSFLLPEDKDISKVKTILNIIKDGEPIESCIEKTRYSGVDILPSNGLARRAGRLVLSSNPKTLLKKIIKPIQSRYDLIFFDVPPIYDRLIESAYCASTKIFLLTDPSAFGIEAALMTKVDIEASCEEFDIKVPTMKVLMTKYNGQRKASKDAWEMLLTTFKDEVLPTSIRDSAEVQNAVNSGLTIYETKTSQVVRENFDEIVDMIFPIQQQITTLQ